MSRPGEPASPRVMSGGVHRQQPGDRVAGGAPRAHGEREVEHDERHRSLGPRNEDVDEDADAGHDECAERPAPANRDRRADDEDRRDHQCGGLAGSPAPTRRSRRGCPDRSWPRCTRGSRRRPSAESTTSGADRPQALELTVEPVHHSTVPNSAGRCIRLATDARVTLGMYVARGTDGTTCKATTPDGESRIVEASHFHTGDTTAMSNTTFPAPFAITTANGHHHTPGRTRRRRGQGLRTRRDRGPRARRRVASSSPPAASPRSWARPAPASRR